MIAGVSYAPADNQLFRAMRGEGEFKNDKRVRVSDVPTLDKALASYSGYQFFQKAGKEKQFLAVLRRRRSRPRLWRLLRFHAVGPGID